MSDSMNTYTTLWERSRYLSRAYWTQYQKLIGSIRWVVNEHSDSESDQDEEYDEYLAGKPDYYDTIVEPQDETESGDDPDVEIDIDSELEQSEGEFDEEEKEDEEINPEYLEFIRITKQHQAERNRLKELELKKKPELNFEEYYVDISHVNTLIEDNLAEVPNKKDLDQLSSVARREERLIEMYGSRGAYERIRSMEMSIDEHFNKKLQELAPNYWPVMPLNPKPYLNSMK